MFKVWSYTGDCVALEIDAEMVGNVGLWYCGQGCEMWRRCRKHVLLTGTLYRGLAALNMPEQS